MSEVEKGRTGCQRRARPLKEGDSWQRSERLAKEEPVVKGGRGRQRRMMVGIGGRGRQMGERLSMKRLAMARLAKEK